MILLLGFLLARLVGWAEGSGNMGRFAAVAAFTSFFLMYPRGEFVSIVRPLVWFSLMPYFIVALSKRAAGRRIHAGRRMHHVGLG